MEEIWKDIPNFEGYYQVSNLGRIKSLPRKYKSRIIEKEIYKVFSKAKGYSIVGLSKNGKVYYYKVHRLVAQAFIPNPERKPCVNHIDCDKNNNCVNNLEWVTHKENNNHKNHNLKLYISHVIRYLERSYPLNKDLILKAYELKKEIEKL